MPNRIELTGSNAFYNLPDYENKTRTELVNPKCLPVHYRFQNESKIWRVVKIIFAILIPIIGLYMGLHALIGKGMLPFFNRNPTSICDAVSMFTHDVRLSNEYALELRERLVQNLTFTSGTDTWKVKRFTIDVNGTSVDAMIVGKPSTFGNGRWVLNSVGNADLYEAHLVPEYYKHPETTSRLGKMLTELNANALVYNYPGKGASEGFRESGTLVNGYHAMLNYLEDQTEGLAAKEVVMYGHSMGTIAQGEALKTHQLKPHIKYVAVKNQPPADLSSAASGLICNCVGSTVKMFGWNLGSVESSKKLKCPEIILQTTSPRKEDIDKLSSNYKKHSWLKFKGELPNNYRELKKPEEVIDDGVITKEASLAKQLLDDPKARRPNQRILGMYENHSETILNWKYLAGLIKEDLK